MIVELKLEDIPPLIEEIAQWIGDLDAEVQILRKLLFESGIVTPEKLEALVEQAKQEQQETLKEDLLQRARERALKQRPLQ